MIARTALVSVLYASIIATSAGCDPTTQRELAASFSDAKPVISDFTGEHDSRIVNNDLDYGFTVSFTLTNTGEKGAVQVMPWLSCSEGEWSREQTLVMDAGETMNLTYFFQEPTINSSNIQYGVRTRPPTRQTQAD